MMTESLKKTAISQDLLLVDLATIQDCLMYMHITNKIQQKQAILPTLNPTHSGAYATIVLQIHDLITRIKMSRYFNHEQHQLHQYTTKDTSVKYNTLASLPTHRNAMLPYS